MGSIPVAVTKKVQKHGLNRVFVGFEKVEIKSAKKVLATNSLF